MYSNSARILCGPFVSASCVNLPADFNNGSISIVGTTATYSCRAAFNIKGDKNRSCTGDGDWTGEEPICEGELQCRFSYRVYFLMD